jgi:membrane fusion protein (multidrug efflux system)
MRVHSSLITLCFASVLVLGSGGLTSCSKKAKKKAASQKTSVSVITAKSQKLQVKYKSSGSLVPITRPSIKATTNGRITQVNAYDGQAVRAKQILATMDNSKQRIAYLQALAKVKSARARLTEKQLEAKSTTLLLKKHVVSKLKAAQVEASAQVAKAEVNEANQNLLQAENLLQDTIIRSPINGHVQKVLISEGDYVTQGATMFQLIDHSLLQARLSFSQTKANDLKVGQRVHLLSPATPGKEYVGQITAVTPSINPDNRTVDVIVTFNSDNLWKSGASINGSVYLEKSNSVYIVPVESLVLRGDGTLLFTVKDGKAIRHDATIVEEQQGYAAVTANIKDGDKIVTHGAHYLSPGAAVSIQTPQSVEQLPKPSVKKASKQPAKATPKNTSSK